MREAGLEVHRPQASQAKAQKSSSIMLAIGPQGQIFLDRKQIDVERVQASVARLLAEQPDASLVIQADERVPHGKGGAMDEAKAASPTRRRHRNMLMSLGWDCPSLGSCCSCTPWWSRPEGEGERRAEVHRHQHAERGDRGAGA